jgi:hypothetical protein
MLNTSSHQATAKRRLKHQLTMQEMAQLPRNSFILGKVLVVKYIFAKVNVIACLKYEKYKEDLCRK